MALSNKNKAKVAKGIGAILGALVKGAGRKKKNSSGNESLAGMPAPKKGCGACG